MKKLSVFAIALLSLFCMDINAQETSSTEVLSLGHIEFTFLASSNDNDIKLQFLLPKDQVMEMYLIDEKGDKVTQLLRKQFVQSGVKNFNFPIKEKLDNHDHFVVIKSNETSIIKKLNL